MKYLLQKNRAGSKYCKYPHAIYFHINAKYIDNFQWCYFLVAYLSILSNIPLKKNQSKNKTKTKKNKNKKQTKNKQKQQKMLRDYVDTPTAH